MITGTRKEIPQVVGGCEKTFAIITWSGNGGTQDVSEHNLVAQRIVKDHIHHVGGLWGVVIAKELLNSVQYGRQRYHAYLEERKTEKENKDKGEKRKLEEEMIHLKRKKDTTRGIY